jgi:hypothetical protein
MLYQELITIRLKMSSNCKVFPRIGSISLHENHSKGDFAIVHGINDRMLGSFNIQGEEVEEEVGADSFYQQCV